MIGLSSGGVWHSDVIVVCISLTRWRFFLLRLVVFLSFFVSVALFCAHTHDWRLAFPIGNFSRFDWTRSMCGTYPADYTAGNNRMVIVNSAYVNPPLSQGSPTPLLSSRVPPSIPMTCRCRLENVSSHLTNTDSAVHWLNRLHNADVQNFDQNRRLFSSVREEHQIVVDKNCRSGGYIA